MVSCQCLAGCIYSLYEMHVHVLVFVLILSVR